MLAIVHPVLTNPPDTSLRPSISSSRLSRHHPRRPLLVTTPPAQPRTPQPSFRRYPTTTSAHSAPPQQSTFRPSQPPFQQQHQPIHHQHPPAPTPQPTAPSSSNNGTPFTPSSTLDIHTYPTPDLLRLLALLLTQIATTNDRLAANSSSVNPDDDHIPPPPLSTSVSEFDPPIWRTLTTASRVAVLSPSSTLTFHARNIPTISLEAYLLRILKYCPTTNQVFLSLLVYFDRMSKISRESTGKPFVIDSYNIHRLVIAGVTVASKFFSDVFYTNLRYAKVGGLPQAELNLLELQFLMLNDFRLAIKGDEMQRYAEQLILFAQSDPPSAPATTVLASATSTASPACLSRAMSAMDAYGRIGVDERSRPTLPNGVGHEQVHVVEHGTSGNRTPFGRRRRKGSCDHGQQQQQQLGETTETETESEAAETETDGETDDEPTIRPAHSTVSEDGGSLYGYASGSGAEEDEDTGDEGGDEDDEVGVLGNCRSLSRVEVEVMVPDTDGDSTPERRPTKDEPMASP